MRLDAEPGALVISGTDRYQLGVARLQATNLDTWPEETSAWFDRSVLSKLVRHIGEAAVRIGWKRTGAGTYVVFSFGTVNVLGESSLEEENGLERLLPHDAAATVTLDRKALGDEVEAATALLAAKRIQPKLQWLEITMTRSGIAVAASLDDRAGVADGPPIDADVDGVDDTRVLYVQPQYLERGLKAFRHEEDVTLHIPEWNRPIVITTSGKALTDKWAFRYGVVQRATKP